MAIIDSIRNSQARRSGNAILRRNHAHTPTVPANQGLFMHASNEPTNPNSTLPIRNIRSLHAYFTINAALGTNPASFSVMPKSVLSHTFLGKF